MAARARAGMVRAFWSWAPARTLATLAVLRTEAETEEERTASRARREGRLYNYDLGGVLHQFEGTTLKIITRDDESLCARRPAILK
jgi:hypothetical protein